MFLDWLSIYQDHEGALPVIGDRHFIAVDSASGEDLGITQPTVTHSGSYSTAIKIRVSGNRVTVTGNPSRIDRIDNLFGFATLDQCVAVYNEILERYGLPPFTRATKRWHGVGEDGEKARVMTDGAVITEVHITSNVTTGKDNAADFIRALSTQPYRHSIPRLHTNGATCDWLTKKGKGSTLIYPSVYNKAFELRLHALSKLQRSHGADSPECKYLQRVIDYCEEHGVVRFEQKVKSAFLRRHDLQFYGFEDMDKLRAIHQEFLKLPEKLQVEAMTFETITQQLISAGVCSSTRSANTTTLYAIQWMHGHQFDISKTQVQTHRARLRKIGIDIALPCDVSKFSLVTVTSARKIQLGQLVAPNWYQQPRPQLRIAA